jgi:hypothetical protein
MTSLKRGELTIESQLVPGAIQLFFLGKSISRDPAADIRPPVTQALDEAAATLARVELHFERLEHLNSSTVAELIRLINLGREKKVKLVVYYDGSLRWQALSFVAIDKAMRPFEGDDDSVRVLAIPRGTAG